ncbi:hypothetical protein [Yoonia sp. SS1-5]|uniref:Ornithine cyclodeaminase n=1 Tax=Yoonia rhodophyticola TaxID=3137370 RepID=A0AAN0NHI8_9RHOB
MTNTPLDKDMLVQRIRANMKNAGKLRYQRALAEFTDQAGAFLGDNVFETSFLLREGQPPLIYEVSGPYDVVSNNYATVGRIYENGERIFESNIKDQIQERTAAMVWIFLAALGHRPHNILLVGAGTLATETVSYLKHFLPDLASLDYHARTARPDSFERRCAALGVDATYQPALELTGYDTVLMMTNTTSHLVDAGTISQMPEGGVLASLCTTSQTGEIAGDVYSRDDVQVFFDYDLTRSFTPDMKAADAAGHLTDVTMLTDLMSAISPADLSGKRNILRITGTPMQNVAVLDILRGG